MLISRYYLACNVLDSVQLFLPKPIEFRRPPPEQVSMSAPYGTYYLHPANDTDITALDKLYAYYKKNYDRHRPHASADHAIVGCIAHDVISQHGMGEMSTDAISVAWAGIIGQKAYTARTGLSIPNRHMFYMDIMKNGVSKSYK